LITATAIVAGCSKTNDLYEVNSSDVQLKSTENIQKPEMEQLDADYELHFDCLGQILIGILTIERFTSILFNS
jgi:hypothetical protein